MSAVEEHKPVEKRRALGRGLDSLLPSGPRIVNSAAPAAVAASVAIPPAAPFVAPPQPSEAQSKAEPAEIAEIHAVRDKPNTQFLQNQGDAPPQNANAGRLGDGGAVGQNIAAAARTGVSAPHQSAAHEIREIPLELIDENP
ncbi:MAG: hypothetical protein ACTHLX_25320, partial [Candidatus Binatia bacterium]